MSSIEDKESDLFKNSNVRKQTYQEMVDDIAAIIRSRVGYCKPW